MNNGQPHARHQYPLASGLHPGSGSRGLRPSKPVEKMSKEEFDREVDNYLNKVFGED